MMFETDKQTLKELEALVFDNPDLERLETLIAEFNIFEAIGVVYQESRHSDFLSFLLDPLGNHGLGDIFLKRFLLRALQNAATPPLDPIWLDVISMNQAFIRREWQNIDILIEDLSNNLVVVIENKILSGEHSDQLRRYLEIVEGAFPHARILPIFLTPEGDTPSVDRFIPLTYNDVAEAVRAILRTAESALGSDVVTIIEHYETMLRRHIVGETETADLCRQIYRRHRRALDLIFEHRPDLQSEIHDYLQGLVNGSAGLLPEHSSKTRIRFSPSKWDSVPQQMMGRGWTSSGRVLIFEFVNMPERLSLLLIIGPGPSSIREALFGLAQEHRKVFHGGSSSLYTKWTTVYKLEFLRAKDYGEGTFESVQPKIDQAWRQFLEIELPQISNLVLHAALPSA